MLFIKKIRLSLYKKLTSLTIRKEILAALLVTAFLPTIVVGFYGGWQLKRFLDNEKISYNKELVRQTGRKLDYIAEDISIAQRLLIVHVISSPLFNNYEEISISERIKEIKESNAYLDTLRQAFPFIEAIYIIDNKNRVYSSLTEFNRGKLLSAAWIKDLTTEQYGNIIIPLHPATYSVFSDSDPVPHTVSVVRKVSKMGNKEDSSIIQIDLNEKLISEILGEYPLDNKGYLQLVDNNNQQIISSTMDLRKKELVSSEEFHEFSFSLENFNWILVAHIHSSKLLTEKKLVIWTFIILIFFVLILAAFFSIAVARRITGPLTRVIIAMDSMGRGDFTYRLPEVTNRDLLSLIRGMNRMNDHLQVLVTNIARKEEEKNRAWINALQAQINPHFLYNTLDVIRGIAQAKGNEDVVNIAAALAKLFRYNIRTKEFVPVSKELEHIQQYLKIQEYRFGNRFRIEYDIDEKIRDCQIIKLILQPLIENAFKHGLEECRKDGLLIISGEISGKYIIISIINNGPLVDKKKIDELNYSFRRNKSIEKEVNDAGLGLSNVDSRLKLNFGFESGLNIKPRDSGGVIVELKFPYMLYEEEK